MGVFEKPNKRWYSFGDHNAGNQIPTRDTYVRAIGRNDQRFSCATRIEPAQLASARTRVPAWRKILHVDTVHAELVLPDEGDGSSGPHPPGASNQPAHLFPNVAHDL